MPQSAASLCAAEADALHRVSTAVVRDVWHAACDSANICAFTPPVPSGPRVLPRTDRLSLCMVDDSLALASLVVLGDVDPFSGYIYEHWFW